MSQGIVLKSEVKKKSALELGKSEGNQARIHGINLRLVREERDSKNVE